MVALNPLSPRTIAFGVGYLFRHPAKFLPRLALKIRQVLDWDYPALAPGAVRLIARELRAVPSPSVAEWGSGRSTLWFAKRCARLVSVEHDAEWHGIVTGELRRRGAHHVSVALAGEASPDYAAAIGVGPFDVILIDGRQRPACAEVARSAIKPGGLIVVDNSNRPECVAFLPNLGTTIGTFTGHATQTTLLRAV